MRSDEVKSIRRFYRDHKTLVETLILLGFLFIFLGGIFFLFGDRLAAFYENSMMRKFINETNWGEGERWSWSDLLDDGLGGSPHRGREFYAPDDPRRGE